MGFDLRITFTGLCLFVPDDSADAASRRMHVLMPAHGHGQHRHYARLVYDEAYARPDATQHDRVLACENIEGGWIELPGSASGGLDLTLTAELVDLGPIVQRRLPRSYLGANPGNLINSRFTLAAGAFNDCETGASFTVNPKGGAPTSPARRMTWRVDWMIHDISGHRLEWALQPFGDGMPRQLPVLHPLGRTIHVSVYNATCPDLPPAKKIPKPNAGRRVDHFDGYLDLFGGSTHDVRLAAEPKAEGGCLGIPGCPKSGFAPGELVGVAAVSPWEVWGGRPLTCVEAQVLPEPQS